MDDEPYNLLGLEMILKMSFKQFNFKEEIVEILVDQACDGQEALSKVQCSLTADKTCYGLIFMDCSMPVMDGYDCSVAIRKYYKQNKVDQPKIVALTGHTEDIYI